MRSRLQQWPSPLAGENLSRERLILLLAGDQNIVLPDGENLSWERLILLLVGDQNIALPDGLTPRGRLVLLCLLRQASLLLRHGLVSPSPFLLVHPPDLIPIFLYRKPSASFYTDKGSLHSYRACDIGNNARNASVWEGLPNSSGGQSCTWKCLPMTSVYMMHRRTSSHAQCIQE